MCRECPGPISITGRWPRVSKVLKHSLQELASFLADTRMNLVYSNDKSLYMLDLNGTMAGMLKMLQRLIGEDINLAWLPGVDVWIVKIDPSRIDQLLANLCINARDAIVGVGKLTIETGTSTSTRTIAPITRALFPGRLSCSL